MRLSEKSWTPGISGLIPASTAVRFGQDAELGELKRLRTPPWGFGRFGLTSFVYFSSVSFCNMPARRLKVQYWFALAGFRGMLHSHPTPFRRKWQLNRKSELSPQNCSVENETTDTPKPSQRGRRRKLGPRPLLINFSGTCLLDRPDPTAHRKRHLLHLLERRHQRP